MAFISDAKNLTNLSTAIAIIENEANLPKEVLIQHMSDLLDYNRHYNVTNLLAKIAALEHKPTLIELTMTPKQLLKLVVHYGQKVIHREKYITF